VKDRLIGVKGLAAAEAIQRVKSREQDDGPRAEDKGDRKIEWKWKWK